ncbi:HEAT repeat domain-containing protein [Undibacterium umbellatum]|uniref:HEAT repeat domain-containing protein n=1 Tax=Undibacterium umbellatum TaxID=2762300 RepID=UPI003BB5FD38
MTLALQGQRPAIWQIAVWGLSEMRFPETCPTIAALLSDPDGALGDIGETRWLDAMLHLLKDDDPRVRSSVAHALGDLQEKASIPALTSILNDADKGVVHQVQWTQMEMN